MQDHGSVGTMDHQLSPCHLLETLIPCGMVKVTMGVDDPDTTQIVFCQCHKYFVHITARIDDGRLSGPFTAKDIAI
jgi:hypothetical protein